MKFIKRKEEGRFRNMELEEMDQATIDREQFGGHCELSPPFRRFELC